MTVILEHTGGSPLKTFDIMVDYDDVIMPWCDPVWNKCGELGMHDFSIPNTSWKMWEAWPNVDEQRWFDGVMAAMNEGLYTHTDPYPYAVDAINGLLWRGHRVHIVTARGFFANGEQIRTWTREHIARYGVGHTSLTFHKDKVAAMHELGVVFDYAIDDGGHNYDVLNDAGINVWLHEQEHNKLHRASQRIGSLWEFAQMIHRDSVKVSA